MKYRVIVLYLVLAFAGLVLVAGNGFALVTCPEPPENAGDSGGSGAASSVDPNALTGPVGFGERHFLAFGSVHPYRIDFENDAAAAVPAQQVDITNNLDANLDRSTFQLTEVGFGDQFISVPSNTKQFETSVSMTYQNVTFGVHINAGINESTGEVYAHFYSIDPKTGLPPSVEIGFLPPEDDSGRGMGHVSYIISHAENVPENIEIRNIALIVFDMGEQIYTNQVDPHDPSQGTDPAKEALVTIDRNRPVSSIVSLAKEVTSSTFTVNWQGSDTASGIAGYDIYTRDGEETEWQLWKKKTPATSAVFAGVPGHTYEFYSVAIDNVGYFEEKQPSPDATTYVNSTEPVDADSDGVADINDNCPTTANADQLNQDGDGLGDVCDVCLLDAQNDSDGDGICGNLDNCPGTFNPDQADADLDGQGNLCDPDDDNDGVADTVDLCPGIANADQSDRDGDGLGDLCDEDDDGDGTADSIDNCPLITNTDQANLDGDSQGDLCDEDDDGDGTADSIDNCPLITNTDQANLDGDSQGDLCDDDDDGDGIADSTDNCPVVANADQANLDGDDLGDLCDDDDDGDGIADSTDNCPVVANADQANLDGDDLGDLCDDDDDGDGIADSTDNCPVVANADQANLDGDDPGDLCDEDDDGDGIADSSDNCPAIANADQADNDGDGLGDTCDACPLDAENDSDADTVCGNVDNCPVIANADQADLDQDGLGNLCDPQTCGNAVLEAPELCDDGNNANGDGCSSLCIRETSISISKAEVEWDDGEVKFTGYIELPSGIFAVNVTPQSDVFIKIADLSPVTAEQINFSVKAVDNKKWEYKSDGSVSKFKIDWKGATL